MTEPAPLIETPLAPAPKGGAAEWFSGADGLKLRAAIFEANGPARGSVVLSPGRTEPLDKYFEVIDELRDRGFVVLVHDWRGQGLSGRMLKDSKKGHAVGFEPYLSDYGRLLDTFSARLPKPWIQMGHSMGGCLSLLALAKGEQRFAASALSAPMLGVIAPGYMHHLARFLVFLARSLNLSGLYLFNDPADPFTSTFEKDRLAHDRTRWERYQSQLLAEPKLAVGNLTWGWLDFALKATAFLQATKSIADIHIPVLIVAAGDDDRVITAETARIAARLPDRTYFEIPEAYHEILMETDDIRAIWWDAFDKLAARVCGPDAKGVGSAA